MFENFNILWNHEFHFQSRLPLASDDLRWSFLPSKDVGVRKGSSSSTSSDSETEEAKADLSSTVEPPPGKWYHVSDSRYIVFPLFYRYSGTVTIISLIISKIILVKGKSAKWKSYGEEWNESYIDSLILILLCLFWFVNLLRFPSGVIFQIYQFQIPFLFNK